MHLKNNRAQAMTEFVIMLPLFLAFFAGVFQFALIFKAKLQLAEIEREVMQYYAYHEQGISLADFVSEYAVNAGIDPKKISVTEAVKEKGFSSGNDQHMKKEMKGIEGLGIMQSFTGLTFTVHYELEMMKLFSAFTGKKKMVLSTTLFTGAGGSFCVTAKGILNKAGGRFTENDTGS